MALKPVNAEPPHAHYPTPPQEGALRFVDKQQYCLSRRCRTPTYITVNGVAYCDTHALHELNRLYIIAKADLSAERRHRLETFVKEMTDENYYKSESAWNALYALINDRH